MKLLDDDIEQILLNTFSAHDEVRIFRAAGVQFTGIGRCQFQKPEYEVVEEIQDDREDEEEEVQTHSNPPDVLLPVAHPDAGGVDDKEFLIVFERKYTSMTRSIQPRSRIVGLAIQDRGHSCPVDVLEARRDEVIIVGHIPVVFSDVTVSCIDDDQNTERQQSFQEGDNGDEMFGDFGKHSICFDLSNPLPLLISWGRPALRIFVGFGLAPFVETNVLKSGIRFSKLENKFQIPDGDLSGVYGFLDNFSSPVGKLA